MSKVLHQYLIPPTILNPSVVENLAKLQDWSERMRVECGRPVYYTCIVIPEGCYTQYEFMRGVSTAFASSSDKERITPGGRIKNGFVEGIRTEDRFIAIRILDSSGELAYEKATSQFFHLEEGGFEVADVLHCHEAGIKHAVMLGNHLSGAQHVKGLLVTPTDQSIRNILKGNKNAPSFEVLYLIQKSDEDTKETSGILVFDFAGRFGKDDKSTALNKIAESGHRVADGTESKIDYIVAAESVLKDEGSMTLKMNQALSKGAKIVSCNDLGSILNTQPN
ncbi:MAG: hypothetical protein E6Q68_04745 [Polynucleobacter sp.]|nr:MAG: hypothetical protein E6Q68_04745 [Polynucleobacter sp.]